ncbi:protein-glutamate methylesterase/protein-glutamine glutaminase [Oceanobacillus alkalisoli]|uniref:protein-glutamate methylesterase/protein-glutamine glutaminase n=1 Tax=Oceanobacillus alkalisoli TaxID=2925113 RepID=UPI001F11DBEC|nr:chemotaxis response regulator protein-glutamate methylesterase [Oceanobacillus alkalisoli]MCF3942413.1 chemotaxis response regulator protein-glutamate methylesterase [Oceanobacillus alkalisoli]
MEKVRVLVVDDSAFMRKMITDILESDERIKVIGTARNGSDGIEKIKRFQPDVVTMDITMPVLDGISALREIMTTMPLPVIMLSSKSGRGTDHTLKAIENGAVDFIMKPSGAISLNIETIQKEIISKVIAAKDAMISARRPVKEQAFRTFPQSSMPTRRTAKDNSLIAIGTSTGGPRALQQVITDLPEDFQTPILIVQHMPPYFTKSLAERLNKLTKLHVKEAMDGDCLQARSIYIAPGDFHMVVEEHGTEYRIKLTKSPPVNNHRPSVDSLFHSIAMLENVNKTAVILTGMGSDGSDGIRQIKKVDKRAFVIAESIESTVIYGMPKAAYETGLVDQVLPLHQIGHFLGKLT